MGYYEKLETFKKCSWENFYQDNKKYISAKDSEETFFNGVKNFIKQFSPPQGFLGLRGEKIRSRKESIEFIVKTGLVNNEKEAEKLIDEIKNESLSLPHAASFNLIELKNSNQECFYKAVLGYDARL